MNSIEGTAKTKPSSVDNPLTKGSVAGSIAKGVGLGLAQSIFPRTTGTVRQVFALAKSLEPDEEKKNRQERKKANDLFGING